MIIKHICTLWYICALFCMIFDMFSWVQLTCLVYLTWHFPCWKSQRDSLMPDWFIHPSIVSLCSGVKDTANCKGILHNMLSGNLWQPSTPSAIWNGKGTGTVNQFKLSIFSDAWGWKGPLPLANKLFFSPQIFASLTSTSHRQYQLCKTVLHVVLANYLVHFRFLN